MGTGETSLKSPRADHAEGAQWATQAFAVLLAVAGALLFWAGRGTTYFNLDDLRQFYTLSWSPSVMLEPFNGHLIPVSRLIFHAVSSLFGPEYWLLRALGVLAVLAVDVLFFALARRRVGAELALAAALPVLFLGSAWEAILWPTAQFTPVLSVAFGLGAFLALESAGQHRDLAVCALLILSVATYTIGLCFVIGVAVALLMDEDRWRRVWVAIVPVVLWGGWWLWALRFEAESELKASNVPDLPEYLVDSLSAVAAALTGIRGVDPKSVDFATHPFPYSEATWILAIGAVVGILLLLRRRGSVPPTLWPFLMTLLVFWTVAGLAVGPGRGAVASRHMLPGVVLLLLVVLEAARGIRVSRDALLAVYAAAAIMTIANLAILRQGAEFFSDYSANAKAQLAMIELAGENARPDFNPGSFVPRAASPFLLLQTGNYLKGVARYGSPADTLADVEAAPADRRRRADQVLGSALGLRGRPVAAPPDARSCRRVTSTRPNGPVALTVPPGGAVLSPRRPSALFLGRFGDVPTAGAALMAAGRWVEVAIPTDASPRPWQANAPTAGRLSVCAIG